MATQEFPMVLLYTSAARLSKGDAEKLSAAGIIPICVRNLDAVKIVSAPAPLPVSPDAMLWAAMQAINKSGWGHDTFFKEMHAALSAARESSKLTK